MEKLDLTLKLGLPTSDESVNQYLQDTTLSLKPPISDDPLWTNTSGGDNKGKSPINMLIGGPYNEGSRNHVDVNLMAYENITKICSPFAGAAAAAASVGGGAPSGGHGSGEVNGLLAPPIGCIMLDVPARRAERERVFANAFEVNASGSPGSGRGRGGMGDHNRGENNNKQSKRCTNFNCNTTDTPMWRRGPLGPKTLCNACGIKFRKEEERKKAREAAGNRDNNKNNGSRRLFINNQFYVNHTN